MADQITPIQGTEPSSQPASTPAAGVSTPVQTPAPQASPQSSASHAPSASVGQEPASQLPQGPRELKDNDEPQEGERFVISSKAFKDRLDRAQRRVMRDLLGTDDPKEAKRLVEQYRGLEKEAEKRRLAEMSERDRERERRKRTEKEFESYKKEVHQREVRQAVNEVENVVSRLAKGVIRDKSLKHALRDFQEYVSGLSDEQADALYNEDDIKSWFENYAKEYEVGKTGAPVEEKIEVGAAPQPKPTPEKVASGKVNLSSKGGLSKKEVNEHLKKLGSNVRI